MPVYNASLYLHDAIASVVQQDYPQWELLIVNDGSTDDSLSVANSFDDPRIRIWSQANTGVAGARNLALAEMKGDYFCFLDSDDLLTPHSLSSRLKCFQSEDVVFADGKVEIYNSLLEKMNTWTPQYVSNHFRSLVRLDGRCFFGPTWMFRRRRSVTYRFDEDLTHGEDLLFFISYSHLGRYCHTDDVILKYRRNPTSAMSNLTGLARGYSLIKKKLERMPQVSFIDRTVFSLRSRKVVFLSFLRSRKPVLAIRYLLLGSV